MQSIRALRAQGIDLEDIKKAIAEATGTGMDKLETLLDDVVARNQAYYMEMIDLAGVTTPEQLIDQEDVWAIYEQTKGQYRNLTGSMGFLVREGRHRVMLEPAKAYQWALDSAELQVQSGAISYDRAIAMAIRELAEKGLCVAFDKNGNPVKNVVKYERGGIQQLDVCIRRAVMTGVNQLNQRYREQSLDYLETDLVEVTAHLGARNIPGPLGFEAHSEWQGKVYRWRRDGGAVYKAEPQRPSPQEQPVQAAQPIQRAAPVGGRPGPLDVTGEYLDAAVPGQGIITYDETFDKKRHQAEVGFSKWLRGAFGGDIRLLDEVNKDKVQTPDYKWRGKLWDLKTVTTEKAADAAIRHGLKQINENPGGIFLDYRGRTVDLTKLQSIINSRMRHSSASSVDIMVVLSDESVRVFRYKK